MVRVTKNYILYDMYSYVYPLVYAYTYVYIVERLLSAFRKQLCKRCYDKDDLLATYFTFVVFIYYIIRKQ